ncbi:MAG: amino acid ABC transporter permease [Halieaceae bacterium]|nr:amino acid ABC transporter permease [Halieaceae bacterium]
MNYSFDFAEVLAELPYLLGGAAITLQIVFIAFFGGALLGLFGALGKVYGPSPLRRSINAYVVFVTNTPALVQIFVLYYALPDAGILLDSLTAVVIALTLNSAAYLTDIIRAGVVSVRQTEIDAALTLNMGRLQILRHVLLPHIASTVFPPLSNFFIWLMLGSSIAALFGVEELTGRAINISTANLRTIETFIVVAVIYVMLTLLASGALSLLGRRVLGVRQRLV